MQIPVAHHKKLTQKKIFFMVFKAQQINLTPS